MNNMDIRFSSTFDPYSIEVDDSGTYTRYYKVNTFELAKSGKPVRLTNARLSMGFSLPMKKKSAGGGGAAKEERAADGRLYDDGYWEYDMPWRLRVNYNLQYSKPYIEAKVTQSVSFSGDLKLTENWEFRLSSGYDFVDKELTYTSIDVTRKLHCWVMTFKLIPFGTYKSYTFQINVVSNMFKDVKFRKAKNWRDNF